MQVYGRGSPFLKNFIFHKRGSPYMSINSRGFNTLKYSKASSFLMNPSIQDELLPFAEELK
jgi:hypothetical protein